MFIHQQIEQVLGSIRDSPEKGYLTTETVRSLPVGVRSLPVGVRSLPVGQWVRRKFEVWFKKIQLFTSKSWFSEG